MGIAILRNVSKPNLECISRIIYHEQVRFILGMTVFPDEIIIWISRLNKADCPPHCGWASSNPLRDCIEQNGRGRENVFSDLNCWARISVCFCLVSGDCNISSPGPQAFRLRVNYMAGFPGSPVCRQKTVGLFQLHICESMNQFLNNKFINQSFSLSISVSLPVSLSIATSSTGSISLKNLDWYSNSFKPKF